MLTVDEQNYPGAKCSLCSIPQIFAVELTKTDDGRFLCEKCILTDAGANTLRAKLAEAFERLEKEKKNKQTRDKFFD